MKQFIVSALFMALAAVSASAAENIINRSAPREGADASLTLYIEDSAGQPLRLIHTQGLGWSRQSNEITARASEPLAVFVDGPSGYVYVWIRDEGWRFTGHLADGKP